MVAAPILTPAKKIRTLTERGIGETAQANGWTKTDAYCDHPVYDANGVELVGKLGGPACGRRHFSGEPKDTWPNYPVQGKSLFFARNSVKNAIAENDGILHLAEGKADTLSLWAAGIANAAGIFGSSMIPDDLAAQLVAMGVRVLSYYAHNDANGSGFKAAYTIAKLLQGSGISVYLYALPNYDGDKVDLNDLWIASGFDADTFTDSLLELQRLTPPEPEPPAPPKRPTMGAISLAPYQDVKAEIKRRVDCFEYMRAFAGQPKDTNTQGGKWLSPARQEKTASFQVYHGDRGACDFGDDSKTYDIFALDILLHGGKFPDALKRLADYAGVKLPEKQVVYPTNTLATEPDQLIQLDQDVIHLPTLPTAHGAALLRYGGAMGESYVIVGRAIFEHAHKSGLAGTPDDIERVTGISAQKTRRVMRAGYRSAFGKDLAVDSLLLNFDHLIPFQDKEQDKSVIKPEQKAADSQTLAHRPADTFAPDLKLLNRWIIDLARPKIAERHSLPRPTKQWFASLGYHASRAEARAVKLAFLDTMTSAHRTAYDKAVHSAAVELLTLWRSLRKRPTFQRYETKQEKIIRLSRAGGSVYGIKNEVKCSPATVYAVERRNRLIRDEQVQRRIKVSPADINGEYIRSTGAKILSIYADSDGVINEAYVAERTASRDMTDSEWEAYQADRAKRLEAARIERERQRNDPQAQHEAMQKAISNPDSAVQLYSTNTLEDESTPIRAGHTLEYSTHLLEQVFRAFKLLPIDGTANRCAAVVDYAMGRHVNIQELYVRKSA